MFIYNGTFQDDSKVISPDASKVAITFVFPAGFALNDPVSAFWKSFEGSKKDGVANSGVVHSITKTPDGSTPTRIRISFGYILDATVDIGPNYKALSVMMHNPGGGDSTSGPFNLTAMHINTANIPSTVVYTGQLEWRHSGQGRAQAEMMTIVVPYGVAEGNFFGLYYQETDEPKTNMFVNGTFRDVKITEGTATYSTDEYTYHFVFSGGQGELSISHSDGFRSERNKFALAYGL